MTAADRLRRLALSLAALAIVVTAAGCSSGGSSDSADPAVTFAQWPPQAAPRAIAAPAEATGGISGAPPTIEVAAPPAPSGAVKSVPVSIARDCSVDVAAALESWIASVPDNSTVSFPAKACYRVDETVLVDGRHRLLLDGNGATLKAVTTGDRDRSQLHLRGGSDLTVRDLIVRGANPHAGATAAAYVVDLEAQHAFQVNGVSNVLLDHVQAYDTYGDFVYIGPVAKQPSRNVTVANSRFARSGRQGMSVTWAVGVTIAANTIDGVARSLFDLEANNRSAVIRDIRIVGNVTGTGVNFWFANKGFAADIGNLQITGNRMDAATGGLVFVYATRGAFRSPIVIERNHFIASGKVNDEDATGALFFSYAANVTIRDNDVVFPKGKRMLAVEIRNSHHVEVTGNHFTNVGPLIVASAGSTDYHAS
jgi:hypothetical protein